ncbi:MAG: glycosyl hydrolase 53 family protein, partial [Bacteroidales bacterium]|nr:glycosyl hydrolase 53 family protein [Bacteroidales bacterium]
MQLQKIPITLIALISLYEVNSQTFYFGNDLSYVNQMEDCGAVYKEKNNAKDVYEIFADHGTNLVRVRLWIDPSWWQGPLVQPAGVKPWYNDLEDVKETILRSKKAGMQVMLGIHYSDFWADPGRQLIPRAWVNAAYDLNALKDTVY